MFIRQRQKRCEYPHLSQTLSAPSPERANSRKPKAKFFLGSRILPARRCVIVIESEGICAQHASQAQQRWSPELDRQEEFWRLGSPSSGSFSVRMVSLCFKKHFRKDKERMTCQPKRKKISTPKLLTL